MYVHCCLVVTCWNRDDLLAPVGNFYCLFVCLFCFFTSQVNSYGHDMTVSSPNHTFSWASLNKQLTSTWFTYFHLLLTTTLLEWFNGREEDDCSNYFMVNLHKSMGPGQDRTCHPSICSQIGICCFFVLSHVVSWVRCGTWLYRFLIFAIFLTLMCCPLCFNNILLKWVWSTVAQLVEH